MDHATLVDALRPLQDRLKDIERTVDTLRAARIRVVAEWADAKGVDFRGMGVRDKIIPGMLAHNGTEPDLIAGESRFIVRLWREGREDRQVRA